MSDGSEPKQEQKDVEGSNANATENQDEQKKRKKYIWFIVIPLILILLSVSAIAIFANYVYFHYDDNDELLYKEEMRKSWMKEHYCREAEHFINLPDCAKEFPERLEALRKTEAKKLLEPCFEPDGSFVIELCKR